MLRINRQMARLDPLEIALLLFAPMLKDMTE